MPSGLPTELQACKGHVFFSLALAVLLSNRQLTRARTAMAALWGLACALGHARGHRLLVLLLVLRAVVFPLPVLLCLHTWRREPRTPTRAHRLPAQPSPAPNPHPRTGSCSTSKCRTPPCAPSCGALPCRSRRRWQVGGLWWRCGACLRVQGVLSGAGALDCRGWTGGDDRGLPHTMPHAVNVFPALSRRGLGGTHHVTNTHYNKYN